VASAIVRQWHLLTLLPKGPRVVDSATLADLLRGRGIVAHRRTIQRDLVELSRTFPIVSEDRHKPYGWRWADDAELMCAIPALPGARREAPEIELVVRVHAAATRAVSEGLRGAAASGRDVKAVALASPTGKVEIRAVVPDGCALRRWLFGFADALEVLAPLDLRDEIAAKAARIASVYASRR